MLRVAALALLLAPPSWQPRPPEPPTVWAEAGSRSWGQCRELERGAQVMVERQAPGSDGPTMWAERVRLCPGAPAVLVAAAMVELRQVMSLPSLLELPGEVAAMTEAQRTSRKRAAYWLAVARSEARRRGEAPPPLTWTLTAEAALGLGEPQQALAALEQAELRAEVEAFHTDRLSALAWLEAGDLSRALELAHRARELGSSRDQTRTTQILALVLDRSGATDAALRELALLRQLQSSADRIDALLPVHERLYLTAIEQLAAKNRENAALLFKGYLACAAPQEPERRLAERRLSELRPSGP